MGNPTRWIVFYFLQKIKNASIAQNNADLVGFVGGATFA